MVSASLSYPPPTFLVLLTPLSPPWPGTPWWFYPQLPFNFHTTWSPQGLITYLQHQLSHPCWLKSSVGAHTIPRGLLSMSRALSHLVLSLVRQDLDSFFYKRKTTHRQLVKGKARIQNLLWLSTAPGYTTYHLECHLQFLLLEIPGLLSCEPYDTLHRHLQFNMSRRLLHPLQTSLPPSSLSQSSRLHGDSGSCSAHSQYCSDVTSSSNVTSLPTPSQVHFCPCSHPRAPTALLYSPVFARTCSLRCVQLPLNEAACSSIQLMLF